MSASGFTAIPNTVMDDESLPLAAKMLYGMILRYAWGGDGSCTASVDTLSRQVGVKRRTFFAMKGLLVERGLLIVEKRKYAKGHTNVYVPQVRAVPVGGDLEGSADSALPVEVGGNVVHHAHRTLCTTRTQKKTNYEEGVEVLSLVNAEVEVEEPLAVVARASNDETELFDYWKERCGHPKAKPTTERLRKVKARLADGYSPDNIRLGIDGAARCAFVNEQGHRFDDLELICRTGSKLEQFMAKADAKPVAGRGKNAALYDALWPETIGVGK